MPTALRTDPTRTLGLQNKFGAVLKQRARLAHSLVIHKIKKDGLDLANSQAGFIVKQTMLGLDTHGNYWFAKYLTQAHRRGLFRAWDETKKVQGDKFTHTNKDEWAVTQIQNYRPHPKSLFVANTTPAITPVAPGTLNPIIVSVGIIIDDFGNDISAAVEAAIQDAIDQGLSPADAAREIALQTGIDPARALRIARTEIVRAFAEAALDGFANLGVEELGVMAEWLTAGDDRVCPRCQSMEGQRFSIEDARGQIPLHPNCRCAWIPYVPLPELPPVHSAGPNDPGIPHHP